MSTRQAWYMTRQTIDDFSEDDCLSLAGALAFYTALSLAPLLVILLRIASMLGESTQQRLVEQIQGLVGPQAGEAIQNIIASANQQPAWGSVAGIISLIVLIFSATGVFAQLQASLDAIWDVEAKPSEGVWGWLRKRLLSAGMIIALAFVMLVSLCISAVIAALMPSGGLLWDGLNFVVSIGVFLLLFAIIFRYLPDVSVQWRDVWMGALVTAVLFAVGKTAIGIYLGKSSVGSAYGAAGSLLVLLVWVYYSSLLVFLGAEFTQVQAKVRRSPIQPDAHAQREANPKHLRPA